MKVYIVTNSLFPYGMAPVKWVICFAKALIQEGVDCKLWYLSRMEAKGGIFKIWLFSFKNRALKVLFWFKFASYKGMFYHLCYLIHNHYKVKYDCQLHAWTKVGWGLYIGHAMSMCISAGCINVNLSQMMNVGTNPHNRAIIGDEVYIGSMTCIVEGVHIGKNTIIGAGSVVTRDIPANSADVGSLACVIGPNKHPEYIQNKWNIIK